jgi:hypothetical protein
MRVDVCTGIDLDCNDGGALVTGQTDDAGRISLPVPLMTAVGGWFKLTSPTTAPSYTYWGFPLTQALYVFGPGRSGIGTGGLSFLTQTEAQMGARNLTVQFDAGADPNLPNLVGTLQVFVEDCLAAPAGGVQVTLDPSDPRTVPLTLAGNPAPSPPITSSGNVGFVFAFVPQGPVTITGTLVATGQVMGKVGAYVRAGTDLPFTFVILRPTQL